MTESEKKQKCAGCRDNFYNSSNSTTGECWSLNDAKMVWKKEIPVDQRPPWTQKARRFLSCFRRTRCVYVSPEQTQ